MATFALFSSSYTIIQGDLNLIDRSQTTTNMDSFNVTTTTLTSQSTAPVSPLESTLRAPFDDASSLSANTMSHRHSDGIPQNIPEAGSTLTSSSMSVEDLYPPSRVFTHQDLHSQRAAYHKSNHSADFVEVPESLSANMIRNSTTQEKLCQCVQVFYKFKVWFNRFFSYLSRNPCISN